MSAAPPCAHCGHLEAEHPEGRACSAVLCRCTEYRARRPQATLLALGGPLSRRRCAHRARTRSQARHNGRFVEREVCRCGASRTRTLRLDGQYEITDWLAP